MIRGTQYRRKERTVNYPINAREERVSLGLQMRGVMTLRDWDLAESGLISAFSDSYASLF